MSDCRRTVEQLTPYVDRALPTEARADVERHLDECPPCRRAAAEAEGGRTVLRDRAEQLRGVTLPPGLRSRCEALARQHGVRPAVGWWRGPLASALAVAGILIITAATLFVLATRRSDVLLAQQLTLDHTKCFKLFASSDPGGVDAHVIEAMLADRYGWNVRVPASSAAAGIVLIGARRCLYASGSIPHVMYRVHGQDVSLFMLDGETRRSVDVETLFGHESRMWSRGDMTYVLVFPRGNADLETTTDYVMARVR